MFSLFFVIGTRAQSAQTTFFTGEETSFIVEFIDDIKLDGDRLTASAKILPIGEKVVINYRMKSFHEKRQLGELLVPNTTCRVTAVLNKPKPSKNPNGFDYKQYLKRRNVFWVMEPAELKQSLCTEGHGNLLSTIKKIRQRQVQKVANYLEQDTAALFAALLFGDRQFMSVETEIHYKKIGIIHLLAISGLHVALIAGLLFSSLLRIGLTREKAEYFLITILPFYAVLTGLSPSVNRAVVMLLLLLLARRLRLKLTPIDTLSIAFLLLVIFTPFVIYEPGFQLSFAVSFALILSSGRILANYHFYPTKMAVVAIVAQVASIPILLTYFYEISLISIVANIVFVPLFSFILLPFIFFSYIVMLLFPFGFSVILPIIETLIRKTNSLSHFFSSVPIATFSLGKPSSVGFLIYVVSFVLFYLNWERFQRGKRPIFVSLLCIPIVIQLLGPFVSPYGEVVFIDVGQGDSIFIKLPYNRGTYLIDTGGTIFFQQDDWQVRRDPFEVGKDVVVPFLKSKGIRKLDKLIATHGDLDHIGGAEAVLEEISVEELLIPITVEMSEMEQKIIKIAQKNKTKILSVEMGKGWEIGGHRFLVLSPIEKLEDKNEGSIVLYANLGGATWLFTGDLGESGEERLISRFPNLKIDVLKVGHHGSRSSSSARFLEMTTPKVAVISAGERNRYGHPHLEVIDRLANSNVKLYRTDQDGAVIYTFKGESGTFHTWIP